MAPSAVDVREEPDRLIVMRPRTGALLDVLPLAALFLLAAVPLALLVRAVDFEDGLRGLLMLAGVTALAVFVLAGFLTAMRTYRRSRLAERLVLDRAARAVVRGDEALAAFADVRGVELRRVAVTGGAPRWRAGLALRDGGLAIPVAQGRHREPVEAAARRVAEFVGVSVEEVG